MQNKNGESFLQNLFKNSEWQQQSIKTNVSPFQVQSPVL